jgi:hypothetical protein
MIEPALTPAVMSSREARREDRSCGMIDRAANPSGQPEKAACCANDLANELRRVP